MVTLTLMDGLEIDFLVKFFIPEDFSIYHDFNIIDTLADGLTFVPYKTYIKVNNNIIANWDYKYDEIKNELNINVINNENIAGNDLDMYLITKVIDKSKIEDTMEINNTTYVTVNEVEGLTTKSQDLKVQFQKVQSNELLVLNDSINTINNLKLGFERVISLMFSPDLYYEYNITTVLPQGLIFDIEKSLVEVENLNSKRFLNNENQDIYAQYVYDITTGKLRVDIRNCEFFYGRNIIVKIGLKIQNPELLNDSKILNFILTANECYCDDLSIKDIKMNFIEPIELLQFVDEAVKILANGTEILFTGVFKIAYDTDNVMYDTFTISDILAPGLSFDLKNSSIILEDGSNIKSFIMYPEDGAYGKIDITFYNYSDIQGKTVLVNIGAVLTDIEKIPEYLLIQNVLTLSINGDAATSVNSDTVIVKFEDSKTKREQSLTNVVKSINKVQKALNELIKYQMKVYFRAKEVSVNMKEFSSVDDLLKKITSIQKYEEVKLNSSNRG
ncbi:hypothetical protein [Clostridium sp. BJN0001]|uniref:hypothetical protein n=1 Tax=Clostridium sp. BJN0001 TaxID=2930219 RepID=UPI001FCFB326|nr:hypothetical protein [Clostridium sp. BJN0001]